MAQEIEHLASKHELKPQYCKRKTRKKERTKERKGRGKEGRKEGTKEGRKEGTKQACNISYLEDIRKTML
jgi:hypothetical protein